MSDRVASSVSIPLGPLSEKVEQMLRIALNGLSKMLDPEEKLFCFTVREKNGFRREGLSHRYSAVALLGLFRAWVAGWEIGIDPRPLGEALLGRAGEVQDIGTLGLLMWMQAELFGEVESRFLERLWELDPERIYPGSEYRTTELAWLLLGLLQAVGVSAREEWADLAHCTFSRLLQNYNERTSLFSFSNRIPLRSRLGFFDGQAYGGLALLRYGERFQKKEPIDWGLSVARTICRLQGKGGEWAWHYNSKSGVVVEQFPVYTVHQDGMAPMLLREALRHGGEEFLDPLLLGLRWVTGENPFGTPMWDSEKGVIWRSVRRIFPLSKLIYLGKIISPYGSPPWSRSLDRLPYLEIDREDRPYHLGWSLYALSDQVPGNKKNNAGSLGKESNARPIRGRRRLA